MDSLKFACSWKGSISGARVSIRVGRIQLEGCSFDGQRLSENQRDSPSFSEIPACTMAWIPKVCLRVTAQMVENILGHMKSWHNKECRPHTHSL